MTDEATPREVGSHAGLCLAPERDAVLAQLDDRTNQTWAGKRARWAALVRAQDSEIQRMRTALRIAREGYASEAATGLPVLPQWRERTVALIDAALGA